MCHYLFIVFILGLYVTNVATSSINTNVATSSINTNVATSSINNNKHFTFYSVPFDGQERATQPLVKTAVECAKLCVGNLPQCYGFEIEPDTFNCQAHSTPTVNVTDLILSGIGQENIFYERVKQCPYWEGFMEVHVNETVFCIAINMSISVNFWNASSLCQAKGGYLLRMDNLDKYDAVYYAKTTLGLDLVRSWVGATDEQIEGQWVHEVDGEPVDPSVFLWKKSEPDSATSEAEDCAVLRGRDRGDIKINDMPCNQRKGFICEAQLQ